MATSSMWIRIRAGSAIAGASKTAPLAVAAAKIAHPPRTAAQAVAVNNDDLERPVAAQLSFLAMRLTSSTRPFSHPNLTSAVGDLDIAGGPS